MYKICSVPECGKKHRGLGYCFGHYQQFKKYGKIKTPTINPRNGIIKYPSGYVYLHKPLHPYASKQGRIKRCNIVWEERTGQIVIPPAVIHHKNGIKNDDSFENLEYYPSNLKHLRDAHHIIKGHKGFIAGGIL